MLHRGATLLTEISCFALVSDCEDQNGILMAFVAVQSDMARTATRDKQFSQAVLSRSADQGVIGENVDGFRDQIYGLGGSGRVALNQEIRKAFECGERLLGIDQSRQVLAFGLSAVSPLVRARR